jgi:hypothetical protein
MRWLFAAVVPLLLQTASPPANLPPAYPRVGTTKILDNDRVQVWNIAWLKGESYPLHRHLYDLVGVYYEPGDRMIISPEGAKRPVSTKAWDIAFQRSGVTHIEEGVSDPPLRAVFVEMKQKNLYGTSASNGAPAFAGTGGTQKLDNDRVTVWEFTQPPPGTSHRHTHNAVVVAFGSTPPKAMWIEQGTVHADDSAGGASRVYVFEIK